MASRYLYGAVAAVALTVGVVTATPANAQIHPDGGLLPLDTHGTVTAVGCLLRSEDGKDFILAKPMQGPLNSVPEAQCSATAGDAALKLNDAGHRGVSEAMIGRWVEIYGPLEKETSNNPNKIRELEVKNFRVVPVVPPQKAEAPAPEPQAIVAEVIETPFVPAPVATSGQEPAPLPKTAGYGPTTGLLGAFALAGCLLLRSFRSRQVV